MGAREDTVTLAFAGDVMLGRFVNEVLAGQDPAYAWDDVLPLLRAADLRLINLECAITTQAEPWRDGHAKAFYFRSDPAVGVPVLRAAGVDLVALANNHVLDFEIAGMRETIAVLGAAGIAHAGAGADATAAWRPARLETRGLRVAVVAVADHPDEWRATERAPGIAHVDVTGDAAPLRRALAEARAGADLVVLSIHWGPNMRDRPTREFRAFARAALDAGADVLWGHSAHVVQGVEAVGGKLVVYDTGDFLDDYAVDERLRNDLSALFLVEVRRGRIAALELVPVRIRGERVHLARGADLVWCLRRFAERSAELGTALVLEGDRLRLALETDPA